MKNKPACYDVIIAGRSPPPPTSHLHAPPFCLCNLVRFVFGFFLLVFYFRMRTKKWMIMHQINTARNNSDFVELLLFRMFHVCKARLCHLLVLHTATNRSHLCPQKSFVFYRNSRKGILFFLRIFVLQNAYLFSILKECLSVALP